MEDLLILVPTYNEENNIKTLLGKIEKYCKSTNILFIDDNSQDQTIDQINQFKQASQLNISILQREKKLGLGKAYIAGFNHALQNKRYSYFLQLDADLSHNPQYIPQMYEKIKEFSLVIGTRYIKGGGIQGWGFMRKCISYCGNYYARLVLSSSIRDLTGGFNMWQRDTLEKIDINTIKSEGYCFQIEMKIQAQWNHLSYYELPIVFKDRISGTSKINNNIIQEAMINVLKLRLNKKNKK